MTFYLPSLAWLLSKALDMTSVGEENPCARLVGMQTAVAAMGRVWQVLKQLKIKLSCDPASSPPGVPEGSGSRGWQTDLYSALFTGARRRRRPKCPSQRTHKRSVVDAHDGVLSSPREDGSPDSCYTWGRLRDTVLSEIAPAHGTDTG